MVKGASRSIGRVVLIYGHNVVVPLAIRIIVVTTAGHNTLRQGIEKPVKDVYLVRPQIGNRATAEVAEPPPVKKLLHVFETVLFQHFLIDGNPRVDFAEWLSRAIPLPVCSSEAAHQLGSLGQIVISVHVAGVTAPLVTDLQKHSCIACRADHGTCLVRCLRHHLFAIHVQSGLQAGVCVASMPKVWCGDDYSVQVQFVFRRNQFFIVEIPLQIGAGSAQGTAALADTVFPDVADCHDMKRRVGNFQHGSGEHFALLAIS